MALDLAKQIAYWRSGATEALDTADFLLAGGRSNFALFFAHLALEKMLKALVVERSHEMAPKTHDLLLLARRAELALPAELALVLGQFQVYCMAGRYPDVDPAGIDRRLAELELTRAQETYKDAPLRTGQAGMQAQFGGDDLMNISLFTPV